jgi:hypothetical protein
MKPLQHHMSFLLLASLCTFGCIAQYGSLNSATTYIAHLEGKGTGQVAAQVHPFQLSSRVTSAYALTNHLFVQGNANLANAAYAGQNQFKPSADLMIGVYKQRHGYQSLSFAIGGGAGNTSIVRNARLLGKFNYLNTNAQIGLSENYGPTRLSMGLSHKMINFYKGEVYLGEDQYQLEKLELLINQRLTHALSAHLGWSYRLDKSLRIQASYDFTFVSMDYNLYDKDSFQIGLMVDLGKMTRPEKPPKMSARRSKTTRKKKVDDLQNED